MIRTQTNTKREHKIYSIDPNWKQISTNACTFVHEISTMNSGRITKHESNVLFLSTYNLEWLSLIRAQKLMLLTCEISNKCK